jgi:hypothetical protein
MEFSDEEDHKFFIGKINGRTGEKLLPWIDVLTTELSRLEASFTAANTEKAIQDSIQPYIEARQELISVLKTLTDDLNTSDSLS